MGENYMLDSLKLNIVDVNDIDALSIESVFNLILWPLGIESLEILIDAFLCRKVKESEKPAIEECIRGALSKINISKSEVYNLNMALTYSEDKNNKELYPIDLIKRFRDRVSETYVSLGQEKINKEEVFTLFRNMSREETAGLIDGLDIHYVGKKPSFNIESIVAVILEFIHYLFNELMAMRNDAFIKGRDDEVARLDGISERLRFKFTADKIEGYVRGEFNRTYATNIADIIANDCAYSKAIGMSSSDCELFLLAYIRNAKNIEFISLEEAYDYLMMVDWNVDNLRILVQYLVTICRKKNGELYSDLEVIEFACAKMKRKIYADAKDTIENKMVDYVIKQEEAQAIPDTIVKKQLTD